MIIPEYMKAAVLHGPNDLRLETVPVPKPGPDEVLIRVRACAICGTDRQIIEHGWPFQPPYGEFIPGHELTGEIVCVGSNVDEFKEGDRVAVEPTKGCGRCSNCIRGLYTACLNYGNKQKGHKHLGHTSNGGYAEYVTQAVTAVHHLPDNITYVEGTIITTAGTALYGIERAGGIEAGETVVILGPGPVGLLALQFARILGAGKTIVVGITETSLRKAKELGADELVNAIREDAVQRIKALTGGYGASLAIECSGSPQSAEMLQWILSKSGRAVFLGYPHKPVLIDIDNLVFNNLMLIASRAEGMRSCERAMKLFEKNLIDARNLISHEFSLDEIHKALEVYFSKSEDVMKVVIKM